LRWCLSKLRPLINGRTNTRILANREQVWINANSLDTDAISVARSVQKTLTGGSPRDLRALLASFRGDFLEGLSVDTAPSFENWLAGQRHRFRQLHQQLLERLSALLPLDDRIEVLRELIEVASFDEAVHIDLVRTLLRRGLYPEAQRQIDASVARFQREGIDPTPLKSAFAAAQRSASNRASVTAVDLVHLDTSSGPQAAHTHRPTILVMPFTAATPDDVEDAESIASDIIFGVAKLRSIRIIAQSTAFSLRARPAAAAAALVNTQYVASGHLHRDAGKYLVSVELAEPNSGRLFWSDEFCCNADDFFSTPASLIARIIAGLDTEIHVIERNRALLMPPASLDAWQAYHRGLAHMFRFTSDNTCEAQAFFTRAIALDPTFSRSYAGLSFTHFQKAFLQQTHEREREVSLGHLQQ
jgi:TolB-like protein